MLLKFYVIVDNSKNYRILCYRQTPCIVTHSWYFHNICTKSLVIFIKNSNIFCQCGNNALKRKERKVAKSKVFLLLIWSTKARPRCPSKFYDQKGNHASISILRIIPDLLTEYLIFEVSSRERPRSSLCDALQVMLTVRRSAVLWCRKTPRGSIAGEWFMTSGTR